MSAAGRVVRAADLRPRPWPNGHGTTRDVAGEEGPGGRPAWLLSIADLRVDAPFSHLPEADRVFTLIEGDPVELSVDGAPPIRSGLLCPTSFPGDRPTASRMTGGPGRAFNAFVDRRGWTVRVAALHLAAGHGAAATGTVAAIHCVSGALVLGRDVDGIGPGDTWIGPSGTAVTAAGAPATLLLVAIDPVDPA